jgi:DNA-directed RNA polymerase subunit RPC12/RpoP
MITNEDKYICPECSSSNIVKLSLIYKHGISNSSSTGTISKSMFNSVDVNLDSDHQTMSSELAEPPTTPVMNFLVNLIISFVFSIVGLFIFYAILFTIVPNTRHITNEQIIIVLILSAVYLLFVLSTIVKLIINSYLYARKYPSAMNRWRNSYQCQRCDSEFILMG